MDLVRVAQQVRRLRQGQGLTVAQLAQKSALSKGFISRLENFRVNPSLNALNRITTALGISMSDFFNEESTSPAYLFGNLEAGEEIERDNSTSFGMRYFSLAYQKLDRQMDPFLIEYRVSEVSRDFMMHPDDEFFLLLEGRIEFYIGDETNCTQMVKGQTVYLSRNLPHKVKLCAGEKLARALVVYDKALPAEDDE